MWTHNLSELIIIDIIKWIDNYQLIVDEVMGELYLPYVNCLLCATPSIACLFPS